MRSLALAGAVLALGAGAVDARPFTVEDLLSTEAVGAAGFDADGRWLVLERRGPLRSAPAFDGAELTHRLATDLLVVDMTAAFPAPRLVHRPRDGGLLAGPFSPGGAHLAVIKVTGPRAQLGVLRLGAEQPTWLDATPNWTPYGQALVWRGPRELLAIVRSAPGLPPGFRSDAAADRAAAALSGRAYRGLASATVNGSGRWAPPGAAFAQALVSVDVATGRQAVLTRGDFEDMELSASGRYVALLTRHGDRPPRPGEAFRGGEALVRRQLRIVDLVTGKVTDPCPGRDLAVLTLRWSPIADELLVFDQSPPDGGEPQVLRVSAATGAVAPLAATGLKTAPLTTLLVASAGALWLGAEPVLYATGPGQARADWRLLASDGPRNLTAGWPDAPAMPVAVTPDGLLFAGPDGGLELVDRDGRRRQVTGQPPRSPIGLGARRQFDPPQITLADLTPPTSLAPGAQALAQGTGSALISMPSKSGVRLEVRRGEDAFLMTQLNTHLADVDLAQAKAVTETTARGPISHWLYRPAGAGAAPLVVIPYPGLDHGAPPAAGSGLMLATMTSAQVLVGAGYAVLMPSLPPLPGPADPAAITAQVDRAVDAAIAAGGIDAHRIAVWGHSFGGYATLAIATQSGRYRAYVASASATDMATAWGRFSLTQAALPAAGLSLAGAGWAENGQARLAAPPWTDPQAYLAASPLYAADRISGPVLLIHGATDTLPVGQAQAMFIALQRQGKDVQLVIYFGEGHVFASPGNIRDLYDRVLAFLAITMPP